MAKVKERQKALRLRKQGKSYSQIKREVSVSKSTLSNWLRDHPLSEKRMRELRDFSEIRIEKYRETMRQKRQIRLDETYRREKKRLLPLTSRELYIAGLFLYWGEGVKGLNTHVGLNNTDPNVVGFYLYWMVNVLGVSKKRVRVYLQLYSDMNIKEKMSYWSKFLNIPLSQFNKPYVKESKFASITHKGFTNGTCGLYVYNARLKERITLGIKAISDRYST